MHHLMYYSNNRVNKYYYVLEYSYIGIFHSRWCFQGHAFGVSCSEDFIFFRVTSDLFYIHFAFFFLFRKIIVDWNLIVLVVHVVDVIFKIAIECWPAADRSILRLWHCVKNTQFRMNENKLCMVVSQWNIRIIIRASYISLQVLNLERSRRHDCNDSHKICKMYILEQTFFFCIQYCI